MPKQITDTTHQRVGIVYKMLLRGINPVHIQNHCKAKFGVNARQARNYITLARQWIAEAVNRDQQIEFGKAALRLDSLFNRAVKMGDFKLAFAVQREIDNVLLRQKYIEDQRLDQAIDSLRETELDPVESIYHLIHEFAQLEKEKISTKKESWEM